jgi:hypothetical protein
MCTYYADG